jgi:ABC-type multidrug transport system fused ATPase/permease subunit
MHFLRKIIFLLSAHERKQAFLLLLMILLMALLDVIGVASILPFMAVLTDPTLVETNFILNKMFNISNKFGIENNKEFLFALGILVFILLVVSLAFKALTSYVQVRFVQMRQYSIGKRLVEGYLNQPYSWFLNRHSADLGKTVLSEISEVVGGGIAPTMELIARVIVTLSLISLLVVADPKLAIVVGFSLGGLYGLIYKLANKYIDQIGKERLKNNQLRFTAISEAFGAAKEVKIGGLEKIYSKRFADPAKIYARNLAAVRVISSLPRYALEAIAFGGILLVILYLMAKTGSFSKALPILSLYAFAGYRLMPALQQIYNSITSITFVTPSLNKLYEDIKNLKSYKNNESGVIIPLENQITLKNIYYNYPNSQRTTLKNLNIKIPAKTTVGLVGATGSGKTTTVDIILSLLEPQKGSLEVDNQVIKMHNSRAWQRSIGYVPQQIYLSDNTIAANIAFGVEPKNINQDLVEKVSKIANLHEFVIKELPKKYQTTIGERGIRLSGGQRQRIGIARALYHNPKVLILDEATSALDNLTEKAVMDAVNNLSKNLTIILIAHRLSTVKKCDKIYILDKGELKKEGTFEDLIKADDNFRLAVKINN